MSAVEAVAQKIAAADVEAVAVMFLHAYINPAHEAAAAARLRALLPAVCAQYTPTKFEEAKRAMLVEIP
jgi:N-methylhydantoinase A/oxoprolinase/acetone carboxylase beta subunit